jgi:hypothetical protein
MDRRLTRPNDAEHDEAANEMTKGEQRHGAFTGED